MITREMIEGLFAQTREHRQAGRVDWDIDGPCRWSYFFVDADRDKLIGAARELRASGYAFAGLLEPERTDDSQGLFLRVDRIETHDVASLLARNDELHAFAARFGVSYDGMDVGGVEERPRS
jgi:hypothetical protein